MRFNHVRATLKSAVLAVGILLLGVGVSLSQQQINLTAGPASLPMPDGSTVPMWGYSCGVPVGSSTATCAKLNPMAMGWSPVVITVPTGQDLTINLTNHLSFGPVASPNNVPTSLVIVGLLGGGLGTTATTTPPPLHDNQGTTWPIANAGATLIPPPQSPRVQSFSTEVATGATTALTWAAPRPGTYLIESGTHPSIQGPMGLYGILVVTSAPTVDSTTGNETAPGTAYPGVSYNAEVPLLLSEIDPVQNNAVSTAVSTSGFSESATSGAFLGGPVTSINLVNGGSGYTSAPMVAFTGGGGSGASATAIIDTDSTSSTFGQVTEIDIVNGGNYVSAPTISFTAVGGGSGAQATTALKLNPNSTAHCSGGAPACYPPAVNYTPLYYMINGVAFDKTNASASVFASSPATGITGSVLVRFVNAGLRMHVPSIVGAQIGSPAFSGFGLIAEDGNPLPGATRVQSEVFLAAGKTYDVLVNAPAGGTALPVFDRELSLSGNAIARDAGMLAYLSINGAALPSSPSLASAIANADTYNSIVPGQTLTVSDPAKGVIANDVNVYGVKVSTTPSHGTVALNSNGTLTYTPDASWSATSSPTTSDSFMYCANGGTAVCTTVTLGSAPVEAGSGITCGDSAYTSNVATSLSIKSPGVLSACKDTAGYPLKVDQSTVTPTGSGWTLAVGADGSFIANVPAPGSYTFTFKSKNSQGTQGATAATVTLTFNHGSGLTVTVVDGKDQTTQISDYRWIIEEDRTFYIDPKCTTNPPPAACPTASNGIVPTFGTNFHTSYMPVVATGCVGPAGAIACESGQTVLGVPAVCDIGNGICRTDASQQAPVDPSQVVLDPNKRYYISVLPGDAANPFNTGNAQGGHGMGGAPIAAGQTSVRVLVEPTPFQTAKLSVFVFEDDFPLNGENDAGGGALGGGDVGLPANEPALGGFEITLFDDAGGTGDATGQMTYDMFNMPLSNSLAGTIDPITHQDACPIAQQVTGNALSGDGSQKGVTGRIITCPTYESDGTTYSPLAGQAIVANLMPGRYGVVATPGADRIARGEEWLQTNTLDGQKAHDSFLRVAEPAYFQEFGPAGYHVSIGFANPAIINSRLPDVCGSPTANCNNSVTGTVTTTRMSRTPDERLYGSGSNDSFAFTQCYVSLGDPDGEDFAFTKCDGNGNFTLSGLPDGNWRLTVFDQWNDMLVDGLSTPVPLKGGSTLNMGEVATNQWQANIYTRTFFDQNGDGVSNVDGSGNPTEPGLPLVATNIRFRDGSFSNFNNTDLNGFAGFNEVFPLFSWYVVETDTTRYKNTGTHVVYDAGGPADGTCTSSTAQCGGSQIASKMANTYEQNPVPPALHVPGAVYCTSGDCSAESIKTSPVGANSPVTNSTGRIDPPWVVTEGWQGFSGQNSYLEFGKKPYAEGENGGIKGHVVYASTRPFDDPQLLLQLSWEPLVPGVTINLYKEGTAPDGSQSLTLVDSTKTSSFDDWAQGFRSDGVPNMNCPGQSTSDLFYFSLYDQPEYLDMYYNGTGAKPLPNNSQFKCYDGMHNWNQLQPARYDGMYQFPSVTAMDPVTGKPTGTNCTVCSPNHAADPTDWNYGLSMLPDGKYVVEVVVPPGYELVKEEDKNILIGDNYIAPVTQQFAGLGNIFILPDQAEVNAFYNANNAQNGTQTLGRNSALPSHEGDTGSIETFWPCVGQSRIVPDYISLFPQSAEVAPFAGATRNLCDRKEVTLTDQTQALAKFYLFTSTHAAAHFTGVITDDFTSEFDPFSPQFGEKFAPPNLPISIKDWNGNEISRVYTDHWGAYTGLTYSTWEVNPPNPTGYAPTMMVTCMNDPGNGPTPDPLYNPQYSQFCYEIPFMPAQTQYMDTPVVPTSAFAGAGYNNPDCAYPDATPAVSEVDGDNVGPYVNAAGNTLTIKALGDQLVPNNAYSGPSATTAPYNQKKVTRHYGFGGQCTSPTPGSPTCNTLSSVTIGGRTATITNWSDTQITVTVPNGVPACAIQQQAQYMGSNAQCGELVITAGNGKQSIDAVTVTVGGKAPSIVSSTIQSAIDNAQPGDLLIVPAGTYNEMVLMWKPVRLQGVGAASSIINANPHPAGKLDPWRREVNCLFGLAINGTPISSTNPYDASSTFTCTPAMQFAVDRTPLEAVVGWDASLNGNLPEQLQEPTLMGAYEGAAITVLGKGVDYHGADPYGSDAFPTGTTLLTSTNCVTSSTDSTNPFPSNFQCNPSSIDGLGVTDSSQGGGGIFVHAWAHNLQIANNRVNSNSGTLAGGIAVGQGEFPPQYLAAGTTNAPPGSCQDSLSALPNTQLPYCFDLYVNVHHNAVTSNSSLGDELFSATPSGAGGVAFCTGADYYQFKYNWVCGNLSSGDGGGVAHVGFSYNGDIEHNAILFNQSTNPTIPTNGGGIAVLGAPDTDPVCGPDVGANADADCAPGTSDGTGPGLLINANLIMGNSADSGSGGGIRLHGVNGTEVTFFPSNPTKWYSVNLTNNIIANNVAGWDGAGVSLQDALVVNLVNNTIVSNDTTASAGILFNTLGAPLSTSPGQSCVQGNGTSSCPQPAGLVAIGNSPTLTATLSAYTLTCPTGHPNCKSLSNPVLYNDLFWQNRAFYIGVGALGSGGQNQQNVVALYNAFGPQTTGNQAPTQPQTDATAPNGGGTVITGGTGACPSPASYWDIGVRGDAGPNSHDSTFTLSPTYSVLTDAADYSGLNNLGSNPTVVSQYCNGSRVPPELGSMGYQVPPGIADATVPNPIFSLAPAATVDEGNNWINMSWGPLAMTHPVTGGPLGNYALAAGSPAIDYIPLLSAGGGVAPSTDFFGHPRPAAPGTPIDVGAVEFPAPPPPVLTSIVPNTGLRGTSVPVTLTGTNLTGATSVTISGLGVTVSGITVVSATQVTATFTSSSTAPLTSRTVRVMGPGGTSNGVTFTVVAPPPPTLTSITPNAGTRGSSVPVTLTGTNLTGATAVTVSGAGVTVSGMTVVSATTITATFTITPTANPIARNVTVTTPGGTSNAVTFTVVPLPVPTLTSITPNTGLRGTAVPVTLTGTNLTGATAITVSGAGVTVSGMTVVNATTITATFAISPTANPIVRNVTVTAPGGTSNAVTFTVVAPTLTSITPNTGTRGSSVPVTLTGTHLTGATAITVSGAGVTVSGMTVVNATTITATFTITPTANPIARNVTVTTPGGTSNAVTFTVVPIPVPTLTSISPNNGLRGHSVPVTLIGTNLTGVTAITVSGAGVTVSGMTVVSATSITATFTISPTANPIVRNVTVTAPGGTSNAVTFTVIAPTLTSITPNTGTRGSSVPVTLTGTHLTGATAITVSGIGVTVSGMTVVSATQITATIAIAPTAPLTARTVTVTTPAGSTNGVAFTVANPPTATLTSVSPNSGHRNNSYSVTLTGTNFTTTGTSVAVSGIGITVTNVNVTSSTAATATFTVGATAPLTARTVTVTNPNGTPSNGVTFTVN